MPPVMAITFLGTGSAYPTPKKSASSIIFRYGGDLWMFDCGEGTQTQLMKSDLKAGKINKIFITHLHGDHLYGLPGLLCTISQSNQRDGPVSIYGPIGLAKYLRVTLGLSQSELGFKFIITEMVPTQGMYASSSSSLRYDISLSDEKNLHPCELPGQVIYPVDQYGTKIWPLIDNSDFTVVGVGLIHRIPSFGFVFTEKNLPGGFDVAKLKHYGLTPGPVCSKLQLGEKVQCADGKEVSLKDVSKPPRPGRKIVVCGDSSNSSQIAPIAQNADVYIHEATLSDSMKDMAIEKGHSTPKMAAEFALLANAKLLYLTHFSQRYTESSSKSKSDICIEDLKKEAQSVFGESVEVADDLKTFHLNLVKL